VRGLGGWDEWGRNNRARRAASPCKRGGAYYVSGMMIFQRSFLCVGVLALVSGPAWGASVEGLANGSFELPELGEVATSGEAGEGWSVRHGGRVSLGKGEGVAAFLDGGRGDAALWQDVGWGWEGDSRYVVRARVGLRAGHEPAAGAALGIYLQEVDREEGGRVRANLAIRTVIAGRDLGDAGGEEGEFEVVFETAPVAPGGRVRVAIAVVASGEAREGAEAAHWLIDSVELEKEKIVREDVEVVEAASGSLSYNRDVRPILSENCFACHGPDAAERAAGLRLDTREGALAKGAVVPGDREASEVYHRLIATDEDEIMPPPEAHKVLSAGDIELLARWIDEGAHYEGHWSFEPLRRPELPAVRDQGWVRQPLDAFVLEKIEEAGLRPAEEADRRVLARRLSLDLTGLPPAPEAVERFVADERPDAYERFVDELMSSVHWGEHRGRYWLDVARYADTHGIHFDNYREIWGYRDWVIEAFNRNLPFDQFTIEQLAGDLLPAPSEEQLIATGFNRCNITTNEGGIIDEEYKVLYAVDRTDTFATTWLGLTASCASCHDHKFDPFSAEDFYALSAFFDNNRVPVRDGNRKDPEPTLMLFQGEDRERWERLQEEIPQLEAALAEAKKSGREEFIAWLDAAQVEDVWSKVPAEGLSLQVPLDGLVEAGVEGGAGLRAVAGGSELLAGGGEGLEVVEGPGGLGGIKIGAPGHELATGTGADLGGAFSVGLWVKLDNTNQTGALLARMDEGNGFRGFDLWLQGGQLGAHLIDQWKEDAIKVVSEGKLANGRWHHVLMTWDGSKKAAGLKLYLDGVEQKVAKVEADSLAGELATDVPLRLGRREVGNGLTGQAASDLRWYSRVLGTDEVAALAGGPLLVGLVGEGVERSGEAIDQLLPLYQGWSGGADELRRLEGQVGELVAERDAIRGRTPVTLIFAEADTLPTAFLLARGEYDQRRDLVAASTPSALPPMSGDLPRDRLGLARWLFTDEQPLTARVTVNRFWSEIFGRGLVETPGDFGLSGMMPSHPELLDWLAMDFREGGWDVKAFFKALVSSATYRQSAAVTEEKLEIDPNNLLLARGPRFRMDAEMVRDYSLAASGLLVRQIGGPSVKPYQPDGVWEAVAMPGSTTRDYRMDGGDALYRRSLYTFWKRSAPPASMEVFNAPNRETCTPQRERTNTPLQALATLNDVQHVEAARHLAGRALVAGDGRADGEILDWIAKEVLARRFRDEEREVLEGSLSRMRAHYEAHGEQAGALVRFGESAAVEGVPEAELAAWTMLCNQVLNLDESLNK
jgi:mono/diheme cytochrome c family protein